MFGRRKIRTNELERVIVLTPQPFTPNADVQYGITIPSYARGRQLAADLRAETVKPTSKPQEA